MFKYNNSLSISYVYNIIIFRGTKQFVRDCSFIQFGKVSRDKAGEGVWFCKFGWKCWWLYGIIPRICHTKFPYIDYGIFWFNKTEDPRGNSLKVEFLFITTDLQQECIKLLIVKQQ